MPWPIVTDTSISAPYERTFQFIHPSAAETRGWAAACSRGERVPQAERICVPAEKALPGVCLCENSGLAGPLHPPNAPQLVERQLFNGTDATFVFQFLKVSPTHSAACLSTRCLGATGHPIHHIYAMWCLDGMLRQSQERSLCLSKCRQFKMAKKG